MAKVSQILSRTGLYFYKQNEDGTYLNYEVIHHIPITIFNYRDDLYFLVTDADPDNFFPMLNSDLISQGFKPNFNHPVNQAKDINTK